MKIKADSGVTLIELMLTVSILLLGLIPLIKLFISANRGTQHMAAQTVAENLVQQMFSQIEQKKWDEKCTYSGEYVAAPSAIGVDGTEVYDDKTTYNDIDDYDGHHENPPTDLSGNAIPGYEAYTIDVSSVEYVTDPKPGPPVHSVPATDFKKVTVTVTWHSPDATGNVTKRKSRIYYNGVSYEK